MASDTARLLTADTCPSCGAVHGQPTDWPTCPEHGHWLYILRGPLAQKDVGWTYACQAHGCKHTHTQKERATMTATNEAATAALAIRNDQDFWTPKQLATLRQLGAEEAPEGDLQVFFHYCQATGLDPFAKQIRLRKDRSKNAQGQWENRWSIETEIDGYRVIAHRAAKRDGVELSYGPTIWFDRAEGEHKLWLGEEPPAGASVTVYKNGKAFGAVVRFSSFAKFNKEGQLMAQWATMPDHMIAKCAEAQALRKAFPHDLEGIRLTGEAAPVSAPEPPPAIQRPLQPPPQRKASANGREALRNGIRKEFDRLGLDDHEERAVYVNRLNNKPADAPFTDLTDRELAVALESLSEKDDDGSYVVTDLAALVELCNPETAS